MTTTAIQSAQLKEDDMTTFFIGDLSIFPQFKNTKLMKTYLKDHNKNRYKDINHFNENGIDFISLKCPDGPGIYSNQYGQKITTLSGKIGVINALDIPKSVNEDLLEMGIIIQNLPETTTKEIYASRIIENGSLCISFFHIQISRQFNQNQQAIL